MVKLFKLAKVTKASAKNKNLFKKAGWVVSKHGTIHKMRNRKPRSNKDKEAVS